MLGCKEHQVLCVVCAGRPYLSSSAYIPRGTHQLLVSRNRPCSRAISASLCFACLSSWPFPAPLVPFLGVPQLLMPDPPSVGHSLSLLSPAYYASYLVSPVQRALSTLNSTKSNSILERTSPAALRAISLAALADRGWGMFRNHPHVAAMSSAVTTV